MHNCDTAHKQPLKTVLSVLGKKHQGFPFSPLGRKAQNETQFFEVSTKTFPMLSKLSLSEPLPISTVWGLSQNREVSGCN